MLSHITLYLYHSFLAQHFNYVYKLLQKTYIYFFPRIRRFYVGEFISVLFNSLFIRSFFLKVQFYYIFLFTVVVLYFHLFVVIYTPHLISPETFALIGSSGQNKIFMETILTISFFRINRILVGCMRLFNDALGHLTYSALGHTHCQFLLVAHSARYSSAHHTWQTGSLTCPV